MGHTFWQYLRLKLIITFLRTLGRFSLRKKLARELSLTGAVQRELVHVPSRDKGRTIKVNIFHPPGASPGEKRPLLINWHGSGFVLYFYGTDTVYCTQMATNAGVVVLDCDYRKSPEYPWPAPTLDVEDVMKWAASQPERWDLSKVALSGFSAGATLSLVGATALRPSVPEMKIKAVLPFYPAADLSNNPGVGVVPDPKRKTTVSVETAFNLFYDSYVPDKETRKDPRVSPLFADPASFPETVAIFACEKDSLAKEGYKLGEKLKDAGVNVIEYTAPKMLHGFDKMSEPGSDNEMERDKMYAEAAKVLKSVFSL